MRMLCDEDWGQTAVATFPMLVITKLQLADPFESSLVTLAPAWRDQIQHFLLLPGGPNCALWSESICCAC